MVCSCKSHKQNEIDIYAKVPNYSVLYVRNVSLMGERETIVDSVVLVNARDTIKLYLPPGDEKMYRITMKDITSAQVTFVNDAKRVRIDIDYFSKKWTVSGSPATTSLNQFIQSQTLFAKNRFSIYSRPLDSLKQKHIVSGKLYDTLISRYNHELRDFFKRYIAYDDTVKNPAAFLSVYKVIDFGEDYGLFRNFVVRNTARFANYKVMAQVKQEAMDVIRVHEKEFNVGDILPPVTLPDINGRPFSTASLKGQYYLIDIWATYCPQCVAFKSAEMKLVNNSHTRLKMVSVALDDETTEWRRLIAENKIGWTNVIDEKMWTGPAVNTLLFDSIPFNFLVGPNGRILKKAIKPDSLSNVISALKLK